MSSQAISELDTLVFGNLCPDVRILLDVSTAIAQDRVHTRSRSDQLVASSSGFLEDSRRKFLRCFQSEGYIINTDSKNISEIFIEIINVIKFRYEIRLLINFFRETSQAFNIRSLSAFFHGEGNACKKTDSQKKCLLGATLSL